MDYICKNYIRSVLYFLYLFIIYLLKKFNWKPVSLTFCFGCRIKAGFTTSKMKFPIKDFFRKFDQIRIKLQSHLVRKILNEKVLLLCSDFFKMCIDPCW